MASKYAKLFFIAVTILVISYSHYVGIFSFYEQNLPYLDSNVEQRISDEAIVLNEYKVQKGSVRTESETNDGENELAENKSSNPFSLYAVGSVLMDADSGRILFEKNGYKELAMASTTKIMTCIVALECGNLEDIVTVSKYAASMPDVQLNIRAGETYYLKDLLHSLMLESHNDSAVAIAEHIGGSVEGFAELMNEKAKELGCEHTHFVTPNGLDAEGHYTTAAELAKIASYAIKNKTFVEITNTPSWGFKELTDGRGMIVTNKNRFLYLMEGAIGVKTGFTNNAGYCFVGALQRDGRTFVSVVLGSGWPPNKSYKWTDTTKLMNYGIDNYAKHVLMDKTLELPNLRVLDGTVSNVAIYANGNLSTLLRADENVSVTYYVPEALTAPVAKETKVGDLVFYIDGTEYTSVPIYAESAVDKISFSYCFEKLMDGFLCFFNN